jgi:GAF domain
VTSSRKGAKSRKRTRSIRSTRTKLKTSRANLVDELEGCRRELAEAREQLRARSEVLQVISSSRGKLDRVFQALLTNAVSICEAKFASLYLREGDAFRVSAQYNAPPAFAEERRREPVLLPGPGTGLDRAAKTKRAVQIANVEAEPAYRSDARAIALIKLADYRTALFVPMLKENELIGVIGMFRQDVRLFTAKQIDLVENFAAQAVIAIENTRLLNELRESLEQQTATSEVLRVISSSPGELKPIFEAMLENATRLCEARYGVLWLKEGDAFRAAALHGAMPPAYTERWADTLFRPSPDVPFARAAARRSRAQRCKRRAWRRDASIKTRVSATPDRTEIEAPAVQASREAVRKRGVRKTR